MKRFAHLLKFLISLAILSLVIVGCGGSSGGSAPPPPPLPPPPISWTAVTSAADAAPVNNMRVVLGDATGILLDYEKGTFASDERHAIASATKWLTSLTIYRLIEQGVMSPGDQPQDYLQYWTNDPADSRSRVTLEHLLAFTSGFNNPPSLPGCVGDGGDTVQNCVQSIYQGDLDTEPGTAFAYGPEHMQIAAAMAEIASGQTYAQLFDQEIRMGLSLSLDSRILFPSAQNPRASGGAESTVDDYVSILGALFDGQALADTTDYYLDKTADPVTLAFVPNVTDREWHYAQGAWRVCEQLVWDATCDNKVIISSPGAFGWTPWIDVTTGYFGLIAMEESIFTSPTTTAVALLHEILPLIEAQLSP